MEKYFSFFGDLISGAKRMFSGLIGGVNRVFNGLVGGAGKVFSGLKGGNRTAVAVAICFAALGFAPGLRADPGEDGSSIGAMT
ncbi:MAG: hypothetical protein LBJ94_01235, partial [Puniceicoccales bacterium]|nr:hypothetical protein [Puniceicoccales bacterium]